MGITQALMGQSEWKLPILPDARRSFLSAVDPRLYLWASIIITPQWFPAGDLSDADLLALARFHGVFLGMGKDGLSLEGEGLEWWFGNSGEGGSLVVGADATVAGNDFEAHLDALVFGASNVLSNGIAKGSVIDANGTTFSVKTEAGDSRREILDTLCAVAPGGPNFWRVNPNITLDADDQTTMWPTTAAPTALLTDTPGGKDGNIDGLTSALRAEGLNGREVRTGIYVDWDDAANTGTSFPTLPSTYATPAGGSPRVRTLIDWRPKRPKPPTERWRKLAAWQIASLARANSIAAREANERAAVRPEATAEVLAYDPWQYDITPGNTAYLYDPEQGLANTANEIYYRGEALHPTTGRIDAMAAPFLEGYGAYFRRWTGAAFEIIDCTPFIEPEEGPTTLNLGTRSRFPLSRVQARALTRRDKRRFYNQAHQSARLKKYLESLARRR